MEQAEARHLKGMEQAEARQSKVNDELMKGQHQLQERQNAFEAKHSSILDRVLDRLGEHDDHIRRYEEDTKAHGADVADLLERVRNLEVESDERKLLDAMLDGRKSQQQGEEEEDAKEEDANTKIPPALSKVADGIGLSTISFEDTKPAPREEIEALAKQGLVKGSCLNKSVVSHIISQYAKDCGINGRRRRKKTCKKDEEFLTLSKIVLSAIPPYPFRENFVYRCINMTPELAVWFQRQTMSGEPFKEPAFTSACAFSPHQQQEMKEIPNIFHVMNTYIAIRSRSGRLVKKYVNSKGFQGEWEVLFCYDTMFRILAFDDTKPGEEHGSGGAGRYQIVMEEVSSCIPGLDGGED
mmetsp:Transcript_11395/g.32249  ORF Transcript_11395/g.32249 Transcript_11395/m.32249 type:complete len:354 (-) Transcript_11395:162-1223(-)